MSLPATPGSAPVESGARRSAWGGDRGVRTKVLAAVAIAALVAVLIGVLGLFSLDSASARTQSLYDANLMGVQQAESLGRTLEETRLAARDVLLSTDADAAQQAVASIDETATKFATAATAYSSVPGATADDVANVAKVVEEYQAYVGQMKTVQTPLALQHDYAAWSAADRRPRMLPHIRRPSRSPCCSPASPLPWPPDSSSPREWPAPRARSRRSLRRWRSAT
jgi:hypothetical protein